MGYESSRVCDLHVRDLVSNSIVLVVLGLSDHSCSFYSSVAGATFFTTLTGFSWSIIQWAPFSLVGQCTIYNGQILIIVQLAEAILTEQAPGEDGGAIVLNDTRTRRRSGSPTLGGDDHERQFLVGDDDEEDEEPAALHSKHRSEPQTQPIEEDVRSFSSDASMDSTSSGSIDLDGRPKPHKRSRSSSAHDSDDEDEEPRAGLGLMQNAHARMSHADVHSMALSDSSTLHAEVEDDEHELGRKGGGLAAKAGIILGIHNVFIVIPQFIMTGLASIIFALLDPSKGSGTVAEVATNATSVDAEVARGEALVSGGGPNSYAIIYRWVCRLGVHGCRSPEATLAGWADCRRRLRLC